MNNMTTDNFCKKYLYLLMLLCLTAFVLFSFYYFRKSSSLIMQKIDALHELIVASSSGGASSCLLSSLNEKLVGYLKVYSAEDKNGPVKLIRLGRKNDGGYLVPHTLLEHSDLLLGYGIADDCSFEEDFSLRTQKPSYGFDCGVSSVKSQTPLFTLVKQCIGTDAFLYGDQKTNQDVSSFSQQRRNLNIENKKIFIKMDIEGAEYEAFPDILKHSHWVTGIVLEIHFSDVKTTQKAISLLKSLQKDFILLNVHGNNYCQDRFWTLSSLGEIPKVLELTYINKNLLKTYTVHPDQSHPSPLDQPNNPHIPDCVFTIE